MRIYAILFFTTWIMLLLSCQHIMAQPTPVITNKYSDAEIEKMLEAYDFANSHDIKPEVKFEQQLQKDFPSARSIEWETAANIYEADFEVGFTDYKAYYDINAHLLAYIVEIKQKELPAIVKNAAMAKYPNYKFEDIHKIIRGTKVLYKVEMEKGKIDIKALLNENGTFIREIYD